MCAYCTGIETAPNAPVLPPPRAAVILPLGRRTTPSVVTLSAAGNVGRGAESLRPCGGSAVALLLSISGAGVTPPAKRCSTWACGGAAPALLGRLLAAAPWPGGLGVIKLVRALSIAASISVESGALCAGAVAAPSLWLGCESDVSTQRGRLRRDDTRPDDDPEYPRESVVGGCAPNCPHCGCCDCCCCACLSGGRFCCREGCCCCCCCCCCC